ncbi:chemotaxis protein CheW [Leptospira ilyithenensis]|uniref:Purine-binding chemotaxis protein CheW n=1 Tax=Leptospira ilyithenensis TaxID=2484901 RepID=A0A4R9LMT2_9LEPT|nr:chemotaxis protein CheW [Leptospira ilyithenensis]TGN08183.1 purine-binding chemotaxis protein CheW [Leptospira ilyithenensis]
MQDIQYLTFRLGEELFGLGILYIKEIIEFEPVTNVPMMPDYIPGVINLRGNVVPVLDLNIRFYKRKTEIGKRTCIVITEVSFGPESLDIGLLVDSVEEVLDIQSTSIENAPSFGSKIRLDFVQGLGKIESGFVVLLKIDQVLNLEELNQLQEKSNLLTN